MTRLGSPLPDAQNANSLEPRGGMAPLSEDGVAVTRAPETLSVAFEDVLIAAPARSSTTLQAVIEVAPSLVSLTTAQEPAAERVTARLAFRRPSLLVSSDRLTVGPPAASRRPHPASVAMTTRLHARL